MSTVSGFAGLRRIDSGVIFEFGAADFHALKRINLLLIAIRYIRKLLLVLLRESFVFNLILGAGSTIQTPQLYVSAPLTSLIFLTAYTKNRRLPLYKVFAPLITTMYRENDIVTFPHSQ